MSYGRASVFDRHAAGRSLPNVKVRFRPIGQGLDVHTSEPRDRAPWAEAGNPSRTPGPRAQSIVNPLIRDGTVLPPQVQAVLSPREMSGWAGVQKRIRPDVSRARTSHWGKMADGPGQAGRRLHLNGVRLCRP